MCVRSWVFVGGVFFFFFWWFVVGENVKSYFLASCFKRKLHLWKVT